MTVDPEEQRQRWGMTPQEFAAFTAEWGPLDEDGVPERWGVTDDQERQLLRYLARGRAGNVSEEDARHVRELRAEVLNRHKRAGATLDELSVASGLRMDKLKALLREFR